MTFRLSSLVLVAVLVLGLLGSPSAWAIFPVFDASNFVQNTLTAARALQQIDNQITQLQNQAQMLINQSRNLARLPSDVVDRLRSNLATTAQLISQAQGLAYNVQRMNSEFARLYPDQYAATVSGDQMAEDAQQRWQNTLDGLHTAMQVQAQVSQNLTSDEGVLTDLVGKSQSATGALQAMQATNQLLALRAKQAIQAQQLQLTQGRAVSLELARQAAAAERGRTITQRFMGSGTPYTPQTVDFYGQ